MLDFNELMGHETNGFVQPKRMRTDKNGRIYHATQRAAGKEFIFDKEIGKYRHNLLCRICARFNVKIIFSVVMSNHTHDVLMAKNVEEISKVLRLVNSAVSHKVREQNPRKYTNGKRVFESRPYLRAIKDIVSLTTVGKYDYDNVKHVLERGEFVPYDCFWALKRGIVVKPYDKELYTALFGMSEKELCDFYESNDSQMVAKLARERFKDWTKLDNDHFFKADFSKPWQDETESVRNPCAP